MQWMAESSAKERRRFREEVTQWMEHRARRLRKTGVSNVSFFVESCMTPSGLSSAVLRRREQGLAGWV